MAGVCPIPRMRRSFRTHEWIRIETQGVALGWYASPLQGDSKCPNSSPPFGTKWIGRRRTFGTKHGPTRVMRPVIRAERWPPRRGCAALCAVLSDMRRTWGAECERSWLLCVAHRHRPKGHRIPHANPVTLWQPCRFPWQAEARTPDCKCPNGTSHTSPGQRPGNHARQMAAF
jgi:hypothetical protein